MSSDKAFIKQYLETALWSSVDGDGNELDRNFSINDVDLDSLKRTIKICLEFICEAEDQSLLVGVDYDTAGHDFWLTRNGHGAGFWDRGLGEQGERLTELSEEFGRVDAVDYKRKDGVNKIEIR
jgi:hypothetical protein